MPRRRYRGRVHPPYRATVHQRCRDTTLPRPRRTTVRLQRHGTAYLRDGASAAVRPGVAGAVERLMEAVVVAADIPLLAVTTAGKVMVFPSAASARLTGLKRPFFGSTHHTPAPATRIQVVL